MHNRANENPDMWIKNSRPRFGEVTMATELNGTGSPWQLICHKLGRNTEK